VGEVHILFSCVAGFLIRLQESGSFWMRKAGRAYCNDDSPGEEFVGEVHILFSCVPGFLIRLQESGSFWMRKAGSQEGIIATTIRLVKSSWVKFTSYFPVLLVSLFAFKSRVHSG
jgi:hypothetical protein